MYVCHYLCIYTCISSYLHKCIDAYSMHRVWWRFWLENRSEIDPKTVPNRSQIGPKSVQDRLRSRPRCQHRFWTVLESFSDRFGSALGGLLAASRGSSWGQVGPKIDFWRSWMAFKNEDDAGYLSEPIFGRFWVDFGVQNRPKIGPESVSRAIMT